MQLAPLREKVLIQVKVEGSIACETIMGWFQIKHPKSWKNLHDVIDYMIISSCPKKLNHNFFTRMFNWKFPLINSSKRKQIAQTHYMALWNNSLNTEREGGGTFNPCTIPHLLAARKYSLILWYSLNTPLPILFFPLRLMHWYMSENICQRSR